MTGSASDPAERLGEVDDLDLGRAGDRGKDRGPRLLDRSRQARPASGAARRLTGSRLAGRPGLGARPRSERRVSTPRSAEPSSTGRPSRCDARRRSSPSDSDSSGPERRQVGHVDHDVRRSASTASRAAARPGAGAPRRSRRRCRRGRPAAPARASRRGLRPANVSSVSCGEIVSSFGSIASPTRTPSMSPSRSSQRSTDRAEAPRNQPISPSMTPVDGRRRRG